MTLLNPALKSQIYAILPERLYCKPIRSTKEYHTSTRQIIFKYKATKNVITKWAYQSILRSRQVRGDQLANRYLNLIGKGASYE